MFLHGTIGMRHRNLIERRVAGQTRRFEHQFQIHHVVNDNRTFPTPFRLPSTFHIPRLDNPCHRTEAGGQGTGSLNNHLLIFWIARQTQTVPKTTIDHKTDIMVPLDVFGIFHRFRIFLCKRQQALISCQLIQIPNRTGEKTTAPIRQVTIINRTVRVQRSHKLTARLDQFNLFSYLFTGKLYVLFNKPVSCPPAGNQRNTECHAH